MSLASAGWARRIVYSATLIFGNSDWGLQSLCGRLTTGDDQRRRGVWSIALLDSQFEWYIAGVTLTIEIERENDGRWLAEVPALPGVMTYGQDRDEAVARVQALALRVIAERLEHREAPVEFLNVTFQAA